MSLQDGYEQRQLNQMAHQEQLHPGQLIDGTVDVNSIIQGNNNPLLNIWSNGQIDTTTGYLTVVNYRQSGTGATPIADAQLVDSGDAYEGNFKVKLTVDVGAEGSGSTAGKIDFFLNFGNGSAGINGYMFEIDYTSGDYAGTIYRVDSGVLTNIGTQKQAVNAAQLNGWKHATIQYHATGTATGKMALYVAGHLQATALDTTYTGTYLLSYAAYGAEGYIKSARITAQHEVPADTFDPNLHPLIDFSQSGHLSKTLDYIPNGSTRASVSVNNSGGSGVPLIVTNMVYGAPSANVAFSANSQANVISTSISLPNDNNYYLVYAYYQVIFSSSNSTGGNYMCWMQDALSTKITASQRVSPNGTGNLTANGTALFGPYQATGQTETIYVFITGNYGGSVYVSATPSGVGTAAPTIYTGLNSVVLPAMPTFQNGTTASTTGGLPY
jgi:hypothetical protein